MKKTFSLVGLLALMGLTLLAGCNAAIPATEEIESTGMMEESTGMMEESTGMMEESAGMMEGSADEGTVEVEVKTE